MAGNIFGSKRARRSFVIADRRIAYIAGYVILWSAQSLLIKASLRDAAGADASPATDYPYEIMGVTLCTELLKMAVALGLILFSNAEWQSKSASVKTRKLAASFRDGCWLIVPAALYVVYNGLVFINLRLLEPATYRILNNMRILFLGLLLQWFFRKRLAAQQWIALLLLVTACVVEQTGTFSLEGGGPLALAMMCIQGMCSSLAGVYFQWLLQKQHGSRQSIGMWTKNFYLYFWSIVTNLVAIVVFRSDLLTPSALFVNFDGAVVPIIAAAAFGGLFTSLLLRHLDVIMKEYASFIEMVVVALMQRVLFGTPLRITMLLAIALVSYSMYMYQSATATDAAPAPMLERDPASTMPMVGSTSRRSSPRSP
ncbi:EamA domain-containing protein [Plasmodiophora brassicae]|nr:hypothetical protein PBRA_003876 [Plasmodiophora brassicae]